MGRYGHDVTVGCIPIFFKMKTKSKHIKRVDRGKQEFPRPRARSLPTPPAPAFPRNKSNQGQTAALNTSRNQYNFYCKTSCLNKQALKKTPEGEINRHQRRTPTTTSTTIPSTTRPPNAP